MARFALHTARSHRVVSVRKYIANYRKNALPTLSLQPYCLRIQFYSSIVLITFDAPVSYSPQFSNPHETTVFHKLETSQWFYKNLIIYHIYACTT